MDYYSAVKKKKKNETMLFTATRMDLEIITLSKSGKDNTIWHHLYVESKKHDTDELIDKTEIDSQT